MALVAALVRKGAARDADELPVVARRMERQLEHTEVLVVAHLAVGLDLREVVEAPAADADDELADAALGVRALLRVLLGEAFVGVVVAGEDEIGAALVERLEDRRHRRVVAVLARGESRVMPHRDRARDLVRGEVLSHPLLLRRSRAATSAHPGAVAVDDDDVPLAEVVAVPALRPISGGGAEV